MHWKKAVAPVVITVIAVLLLFSWLLKVLYCSVCSGLLKASVGLILAALIGVAVFVLVERIKEIRSGEEDDLSQY